MVGRPAICENPDCGRETYIIYIDDGHRKLCEDCYQPETKRANREESY